MELDGNSQSSDLKAQPICQVNETAGQMTMMTENFQQFELTFQFSHCFNIIVTVTDHNIATDRRRCRVTIVASCWWFQQMCGGSINTRWRWGRSGRPGVWTTHGYLFSLQLSIYLNKYQQWLSLMQHIWRHLKKWTKPKDVINNYE